MLTDLELDRYGVITRMQRQYRTGKPLQASDGLIDNGVYVSINPPVTVLTVEQSFSLTVFFNTIVGSGSLPTYPTKDTCTVRFLFR